VHIMGRVKAFDDPYSWLHFAYAALLAALEPLALIAASIVFVAYQVYEREKWAVKRGDFVEWLTGILAGTIAHKCVEMHTLPW